MNRKLLNFSSLHPAQIIGEKKSYFNVVNDDGKLNTHYYTWEYTTPSNIIFNSKLGNASFLIYTLPLLTNDWLNSYAGGLGTALVIGGAFIGLVDVVACSMAQKCKEYEHKFVFSPLSKTASVVLLNSAVYTVLFPAKLIAKLKVKRELKQQNLFSKSKLGREV